MLSKLMPSGLTENRSVDYKSRKQKDEAIQTQKFPDEVATADNVEAKSKNSKASSSVKSNWEKYRDIVTQQDSVQKQPKRSHSKSATFWKEKHKAKRMLHTEVTNKFIMVTRGTVLAKLFYKNFIFILIIINFQEANENCATIENGTSEKEKELTKQIAMDCEMVGIGDGTDSMLARISLVNRHGFCIYDKYVKPREKIQDYRTAVSGIRPHHLQDGEDFDVVQSEVAEILRGRLLVGHALKNDLDVLFLSHPKRHLRDTARYKPFRKVVGGNTPSLRKLAAELLGVNIQMGEHNSIEDARAAMQLYVLYKAQWEMDVHSHGHDR